jgi:signal peptidase I
MLSLVALIGIEAACFVVTAWFIAVSARWMGSPKGKIGVGMGAYVIIIVVDSAVAILPVVVGLHLAWINVLLFIVQVYLTFLILRHMFRLSPRRTFVPFFAMIFSTIFQFVLMLVVVRAFWFEAFVLPTESMSPTLVPGDRFVVNKLGHPARWDLVAYHSITPGAPVYCKRVVGLPGERVRFDQGNVYVNDQLMSAPAVVAGRYHATIPRVATKYRDGETIVLSDREFFVVGDNVDVSADSRIYGPTDGSAMVGVIDFVYWPVGHARIVRY